MLPLRVSISVVDQAEGREILNWSYPVFFKNVVIGRGSLCHPHSGIPVSVPFGTLFKFDARTFVIRPCYNGLSSMVRRSGKSKYCGHHSEDWSRTVRDRTVVTHVQMTEWERDVRSSRSNFIAHNFLNVMISYNVLSAYQLLAVPKCFTHAVKVY